MLHSMRSRWGWFVGLGMLSCVAGVTALLLDATATIVSVVIIGVFMMIVGAVEVALGFRARTWGRTLYFEIAGLLYLVAGILAIIDPIPASFIITLFIGAGLVATGIVRVVIAFKMMQGSPGRGPLLAAGAVTTLLGLVIVLGWPGNSLVVLGTLLGIDLLFTGVGWIAGGMRLRAAA